MRARENQSGRDPSGVNTWDPTLSDGEDSSEGFSVCVRGRSSGKIRGSRRHKTSTGDPGVGREAWGVGREARGARREAREERRKSKDGKRGGSREPGAGSRASGVGSRDGGEEVRGGRFGWRSGFGRGGDGEEGEGAEQVQCPDSARTDRMGERVSLKS